MKRFQGSILVETAISAAVFTLAILIIYLGFLQARKISGRNQELSIAISLLNTQIDTDSKVDYNTLTPTTPAPISLTLLPNATLTRTITTDAPKSIKMVLYSLKWQSTNGPNEIKANYELTAAGLNND